MVGLGALVGLDMLLVLVVVGLRPGVMVGSEAGGLVVVIQEEALL